MKKMVMLSINVLLVCILITADARSLQKVSEKNVTKRAANGEFYPDWVPFKNKQELGEFVQVEPKKKPKKRLALPASFKLKAVAAPDNEYDDFGAGGSEGEDFEKKEWSDLNRPAIDDAPIKLVNHTDISDIDGVVNIITQRKPSIVHLINTNQNAKQRSAIKKVEITTKPDSDDYLDHSKEMETTKKETQEEKEKNIGKENKDDKENKEEEEKVDTEQKEESEEKESREEKQAKSSEEVKHSEKPNKNSQIDDEYEDDQKTKEKQEQTERERKESEKRKALILDAVDELKARHQAEQIILSEKAKEEEIFKEEHERDKIDSEEGRDKYERRKPQMDPYEDYEDSVAHSSYDKYKINLETTTSKTVPTTTTRRPATRRHKKKKKERVKTMNTKNAESGKLSVFKNPGAYMILEEETTTSPTTAIPTRATPRKTTRFSSKFTTRHTTTTPKNSDESVRISLVPETSDSENSPTLFFPQTKNKRKKKRGKAQKNKNPSPDSYVAETVEDKTAENISKLFIVTPEVIDTTGSDTKNVDTNTGPSAPESVQITGNGGSDVVAASSDNKENKKGGNYEHKRGGGREYSSSHEEVHGEHGKKAYEGRHEDTKQAKGHHDREDHSGEYVDKAGSQKEHHDASHHYGAHHHEEHGKKHAKYEESGKHSKGHNTKGSHDIHKKEEYEKRVEFFEEDGDSSEEEKHGGYNHEREHSTGGHFKKGKLEAGHQSNDKGDTGHHLRGGHAHGHKGHKLAEGHDGHGRHHQANYQKKGQQSGKKWGYVHGAPGKVANLITIDRRADQYYYGPQYYG